LALALQRAVALGPERIEINVYVAGKEAEKAEAGEAFVPTLADDVTRRVVKEWPDMPEEDRQEWLALAEESSALGGRWRQNESKAGGLIVRHCGSSLLRAVHGGTRPASTSRLAARFGRCARFCQRCWRGYQWWCASECPATLLPGPTRSRCVCSMAIGDRL